MKRVPETFWPLLALLLGACGGAGPTATITETRTTSAPSSPVVPNAPPEKRFSTLDMGSGGASEDAGGGLDYDLPSGWKDLPPTKEHLVQAQPGGDPRALCYLSFLPGSASGLAANVNRWRGQFSAEPLAPEAIQALAKHPLLGRDATVVEVNGTYKGMGEGAPQADFALLGLMICEEAGSLFLKFTGPAALVSAEHEHFLSFASSLRLAAGHAAASGAAADRPMDMEQPPSGAAFSWKAPAGWRDAGPRAMREVTFAIGDGGECYVSRFAGSMNGLRANLDRWSQQFGKGQLSDAQFQALTQVKLLGVATPLFEVSGSYRGMDGGTLEGQKLIGVARIRDDESVFVKFTGPEALVQAEREHFLAFVASLKEGQ